MAGHLLHLVIMERVVLLLFPVLSAAVGYLPDGAVGLLAILLSAVSVARTIYFALKGHWIWALLVREDMVAAIKI